MEIPDLLDTAWIRLCIDCPAAQNKKHRNNRWLCFGTSRTRCSSIGECGIAGLPRPLNNDREFRWLLESLDAPVVDVVFDPAARIAETESEPPRLTITELLQDHLTADNSPWNYPVYVVAQEDGFLSIEGHDANGRAITAIGFFADEDRLEAYLQEVGEVGTGCALRNLDEARRFLIGIQLQVSAVAWNPTVSEGNRSAKHCFAISTLLEKYLVQAPDTGR